MKNLIQSIKMLLVMSVMLGGIYPLMMTGFGYAFFKEKVTGSLIKNERGGVVGSALISQSFKDPKYFWSRPSAVNHLPLSSSGSNLSVLSETLKNQVQERRISGQVYDGLFASASGLDPHITPMNAKEQAIRVAAARGLTQERVLELVARSIEPRQFGILGEERINVLQLNILLDGESL